MLRTHDRYGHRIDEVEFHPSWHWLMRTAVGWGLHAIRPQSTAANGDIVVAMLEGEATVKRFFKEKDRVRLQPENDALEPIYARDVDILGRVVGVCRRVA